MNQQSKDSIKALVSRIKESDEKAFQILFEMLWESLYSYAYSLLENGDIAKDLVQDVWIDFWERRKEIKNENIKSYLHTAIRYKVLNEFRNSKIQKSYTEVFEQLYDDQVDVDVEITEEDTGLIIEKTLSTLPTKCKEIFKLSRLSGLKNKEIAEELGISERTVETHISKAIRLIKKGAAFLILIAILLFNIS